MNKRRASARVGRIDSVPIVSEMDLLEAKARVCDAYRAWLTTTAKRERAAVDDALAAVSQLERWLVAAAEAKATAEQH